MIALVACVAIAALGTVAVMLVLQMREQDARHAAERKWWATRAIHGASEAVAMEHAEVVAARPKQPRREPVPIPEGM